MNNSQITYLLARLPIGFSFLGHGLARLPKLPAFAEGMASSFAETILPNFVVLGFGYTLPILELILGTFLLAGIQMRKSCVGGVLLICILIFGSSLTESWSSVATQMFYGAYLAVLFYFSEHSINIFKR